MTNSDVHFNSELKINDKPLKIVDTFKYHGSIIDETGSTSEIL